MENKKIILRFRAINHDIFEAIVNGKKKIETRAATEKFRNIKAGDTVILVCGKERAEKKVIKVEIFKSIAEILKKYRPEDFNPKIHAAQEARDMWHSFPGYKEKILKYGLVVMRLK
jgi:ASC-1-like (ASCH) protein